VKEYFENTTNSDELAIPPESTLHWVSSPPSTSSPNSDLLEDFHLMSQCNHNIIIASSYAWWAAYLIRNDRKIVIAGHHNPELFKDDPSVSVQVFLLSHPVAFDGPDLHKVKVTDESSNITYIILVLSLILCVCIYFS
jgi:hypothetical protein